MKNTIHLLMCASIGWMAFAVPAFAGAVTRHRPDTLHYLIRNNVTPVGAGPQTINGTFQLQFVQRGETTRETLALKMGGLETNANVSLTAAIGPDPANVMTVAHLPTDKKGRLRMTFVTRTPEPRRPGRTPPLPAVLSPLTEVGAICVEDSTGQVVGNAGVQDANRFQYVARRNLTPADPEGTAAGSISLSASQRRTNLSLLAGGLSPNTDYFVTVNDATVGVIRADQRGRLRMRGWPDGAPPVLALRSLALTDSTGATILSTVFPK